MLTRRDKKEYSIGYLSSNNIASRLALETMTSTAIFEESRNGLVLDAVRHIFQVHRNALLLIV